MTWSIVAHDPATGAFGVAVSTRALAVGATCPFLRAGVGAVSTQAVANRYLGPAVLDGMARGLHPQDAIEAALAGDRGREIRQIHAVDRHGRKGAHTGRQAVAWAGHADVDGASCAGNILAGPSVVTDTLAAYVASDDLPFPERLVVALAAGEAVGGDRRGRQSAAIQVITTEDFPDLDLRVDEHPDPVAELSRLVRLWRGSRAPFLDRLPRRADPSGEVDLDAIEARWRAAGDDLRFTR